MDEVKLLPCEEEALILLMLGELHANVPEADRPMSMSDLSDDQAQRARNAVRKVIVASLLSAPAGRFASIAELERALAAMPAIPPQSLDDHALPPSGLSRDASQAKPAVAIARKEP